MGTLFFAATMIQSAGIARTGAGRSAFINSIGVVLSAQALHAAAAGHFLLGEAVTPQLIRSSFQAAPPSPWSSFPRQRPIPEGTGLHEWLYTGNIRE
jgi:long-subunit fatty acid transport protein